MHAQALAAQAMHVPVQVVQGVAVPVVDRASRRARGSASTRTGIRAMHRAFHPITPIRVSVRMVQHVRQVARLAHAQAAPAATVGRAAIAVPVVRAVHRVVPVARVDAHRAAAIVARPAAVIAVAKMRQAQ